jgi:protein TonB
MKNSILRTFAAPFICLVLLTSGVLVFPTRGQEVSIDGTSLRVTLPPNWELGASKLGSPKHTVLRYKGEQGYEIVVNHLTKWLEGLSTPMSLPFECDFYLGVFRKIPDGRSASLMARPDYFPEEFYSRVLSTQSLQQSGTQEVIACLFLGNSNLTVDLQPAPAEMQVPNLTRMLWAIVEAGKRQSTLLYAPGRIHLSMLNISPSFSSGSWGVSQQKIPNMGDTDLLVRTGGSVEMKVTPIVSKGNCADGMNPSAPFIKGLTDQSATARIRRNPSYVSSKWQPIALEVPFPPETLERPVVSRLQITTCRQLDPSTELIVLIGYGSEEISQADAPIIATSLDEIADAALRGPKGDGVMYLPQLSIPAAPSGNTVNGVIGGLSNADSTTSAARNQRIQIAGNVQEAHINKRVPPVYPPLARQSKVSGTVKLHVLIDKQGNVIELQAVSGHPLLIQSAMDAVKQWQYKPTLLNGRPVLVETEVNVIFDLKASGQAIP